MNGRLVVGNNVARIEVWQHKRIILYICYPPSHLEGFWLGYFNKPQELAPNHYVLILGNFFPLGVYVKNLSEYFVKSPEEIVRLLKSGKKRLAVAETK